MESIMTIVITAGSGRLGQAVAAEFHRRGAAGSVRVTARNPGKLADLKARGFQIGRADYDDGSSLAAAFAGADTMLLISSYGGTSADRIRQHAKAIEAAAGAGIKRVAYTSFTNPTPASKFVNVAPHVETEKLIRASGLRYAIFRNNLYLANIVGDLTKAGETGVLAIPGARGRAAYITHQDLAAAIAGGLLSNSEANDIFELTGSEAVDAYQLAAALETATGKNIQVRDVPFEEARAGFLAIGFGEEGAAGYLSLFAAIAANEYAAVSTDAARLAGRRIGSARDGIQKLFGGAAKS
jgi:NAD(P)H dehydrogenase (quinone)